MTATAICAACRHYPGRDALCPVGHRHATAAPKQCAQYEPGAQAERVSALRTAAVSLRRRGNQAAYAHVLETAHEAAEGAK